MLVGGREEHLQNPLLVPATAYDARQRFRARMIPAVRDEVVDGIGKVVVLLAEHCRTGHVGSRIRARASRDGSPCPGGSKQMLCDLRVNGFQEVRESPIVGKLADDAEVEVDELVGQLSVPLLALGVRVLLALGVRVPSNDVADGRKRLRESQRVSQEVRFESRRSRLPQGDNVLVQRRVELLPESAPRGHFDKLLQGPGARESAFFDPQERRSL
ncbi:hypothetical protein DFJ74DRAFT_147973 [Hyaloraphidium curvatum]|nr:hypothetical protein DFJ74DRAFT_147973 [Hyaloraphidium curvatum]